MCRSVYDNQTVIIVMTSFKAVIAPGWEVEPCESSLWFGQLKKRSYSMFKDLFGGAGRKILFPAAEPGEIVSRNITAVFISHFLKGCTQMCEDSAGWFYQGSPSPLGSHSLSYLDAPACSFAWLAGRVKSTACLWADPHWRSAGLRLGPDLPQPIIKLLKGAMAFIKRRGFLASSVVHAPAAAEEGN